MKIISLLFGLMLLLSCAKEVDIDIPQLGPQLVVDGQIEVNGYPLVLLTLSKNIADTVSLATYLNSVVNDASVNVICNNDTFSLSPIPIYELPLVSQKRMAEILRLELEEVQLLPIEVYTTEDFIGEVNKSYQLLIDYDGKIFTGSTYLPPPTPLDTLYWKREPQTQDYGFSWARLTDPYQTLDAYRWEVRRINQNEIGEELDPIFRRARGGIFSDAYFNGLAIEFYYQNPLKRKDSTHLKEFRRYYRYGDSVIVKLSKMDQAVYNYYDRKSAQLDAANNPYATPINIPSNISGCLGIWAGFSPWYDTLICID